MPPKSGCVIPTEKSSMRMGRGRKGDKEVKY